MKLKYELKKEVKYKPRIAAEIEAGAGIVGFAMATFWWLIIFIMVAAHNEINALALSLIMLTVFILCVILGIVLISNKRVVTKYVVIDKKKCKL